MQKSVSVLTTGVILILLLSGCQTMRQNPLDWGPPPDFVFPEAIAGMEQSHRVDYEEEFPGMGYSVAYGHSQSRLDIYIYDLGQSDIPNGIYSEPAGFAYAHSLHEIEQVAEEGIYVGLEMLQQGNKTIGNLGFRGVEFRYRMEDQPFRTYLWVTGLHQKLLKIRLTVPDFGDEAMAVLDAMQRSLALDFIDPNLELVDGPRFFQIYLDEAMDPEDMANFGAKLTYLLRISSVGKDEFEARLLPYGLLHRSFRMELEALKAATESAMRSQSEGNAIHEYWMQLHALEAAGHLPAYVAHFRHAIPPPSQSIPSEAMEACLQWVNVHMPDADHDLVDSFGAVLVLPTLNSPP